MLRHSVSVDMKVYDSNKKKIHRVFSTEFCEILLEHLFSRIILGNCFWKENRGGEERTVNFVVWGFHLFQGSYLVSQEAFQFGLCYPFL